jgi:acetate kinase
MAAALGGLDVLVFTGRVGERSAPVRVRATEGLRFLGVAVDAGRNAAATGDRELSTVGAAVATLAIAAREDLEMARQARRRLAA